MPPLSFQPSGCPAAVERGADALRGRRGVEAVQRGATLVSGPDQTHRSDGRPRRHVLNPVGRRVEGVRRGVDAEGDQADAVTRNIDATRVIGESTEDGIGTTGSDPPLELLAVESTQCRAVEQPTVTRLAGLEDFVAREERGADRTDVGVAGRERAPALGRAVRRPGISLGERRTQLDDTVTEVPARGGAGEARRSVAAVLTVAGCHVQASRTV